MNENFPTYKDLKGSAIFESEQIKGMSIEQIKEGEQAYAIFLEKLEKGEEIDEGVFGAIIGGAAGALIGPAIGKAMCKALGVDEKGNFGKLLTSRLVTTAIGIALGK